MQPFTVPTPRGPLAAWRTGRGPALVLIAGLGATARIWGELPHLLADRFTVLAFDNRGVGGSREGDPFTLDRAVEDVVAVLDAAGVAQADLVGASLGGTIALATAVAAPGRVSRLVAVSCAAHLSAHGRFSLGLLRDLFRHLPPALAGRALMSLAFAPPFVERHPAFVRQTIELYGPAAEDVPGALTQAEALLAGFDLRPQLVCVRAPALVLSGRRDPVVAAEDTAAAAAALPAAELVTLPEAAHSVLAEGGPELLARIHSFLRD